MQADRQRAELDRTMDITRRKAAVRSLPEVRTNTRLAHSFVSYSNCRNLLSTESIDLGYTIAAARSYYRTR